VDVAVCAAAVADWRPAAAGQQKFKKEVGAAPPVIELTENPDILKTLAQAGPTRPPLVIGFAAETQNVVANAQQKLDRKGCDWILANDVSPACGTFGGTNTSLHLIRTGAEPEDWGPASKEAAAKRLVSNISRYFRTHPASVA
jgi:phosphopantothenoylcysteine decarboxylase/phosphopantothenate--cysteine ligase